MGQPGRSCLSGDVRHAARQFVLLAAPAEQAMFPDLPVRQHSPPDTKALEAYSLSSQLAVWQTLAASSICSSVVWGPCPCNLMKAPTPITALSQPDDGLCELDGETWAQIPGSPLPLPLCSHHCITQTPKCICKELFLTQRD